LRDRARRPDAVAALAVVLLTLLVIASMNNWRGGWTIGPRYLALTVPFVAWVALEGLDRLADRAETLTLTLALGCALAAIVASGLPSAYFPHLPPEATRPLPDVVWLLVRHDFAPRNAGAFVGVHGTLSMLPLFAAFAAALGACLASVHAWRARGVLAVGAALVGLVVLLPHHTGAAPAQDVAGVRAFITERWTPAGYDLAARTARELGTRASLPDSELRRLVRIYEEEGRMREAARARAGRL
jgi:hypothetical protein